MTSKVIATFGVVAAILVAPRIAGAATAPTVDTTISIPTSSDCASQSTGPFKTAISPDGSALYVSLNGDSRIAKIDTVTNTVTATACAAGRYPEGLAVSADGSRLYSANGAASTMRVFNTSDMTTVADVTVGGSSNGVDVIAAPVSVGKVYVHLHVEGSVVVVSATTNTVIGSPIVLGGTNTRRARGLAMSPDGSTLYALTDTGISIISTSTDTIANTIAVTDPRGISVSPDGSFLYVIGGPTGDALIRIRTSDNTVVASATVGANPVDVAIAPDGKHALVVLNGTNEVKGIDTATNTVISTVAVGGSPYGLAATPDGKYAYVANWGGGFGDTVSRLSLTWGSTLPPTGGAVAAPLGVAGVLLAGGSCLLTARRRAARCPK